MDRCPPDSAGRRSGTHPALHKRRKKEIQVKKSFFNDNVRIGNLPFILDDEQAGTLLSKTNTLITARAGSGKTRVLVAKIVDLIYNEKCKEDEVLAFCFNKYATQEIKKRLCEQVSINGQEIDKFDSIYTFHSFALNIIGQKGEILVDDKKQDRTELIKKIID